MKLLKKTYISYLATITMIMVAYFSCQAQSLTSENNGLGYQLGDLHCIYTQLDENPMWLEVIQDPNHEKLQSITLPEEMVIDGEGWLFSGERPTIIERIGHKAFCNSKIINIKIPASIRRIGDSAFESTLLENVEFSEDLVFLGDRAFANNYNIESIKLPEGLRYIDYACFLSCTSLKEVILPSSLISLGGFSFRYCGAIENIYCYAETPSTADDSDFGIVHYQDSPVFDIPETPNFNKCNLHVPSGSEDLYKSASGWKNFKNIVAIEDNNTDVEQVISDTTFEYYITGNTVTIPCNQDDSISVFNPAGDCLIKSRITNSSEFSFIGEGIYIVKLNDKSIKIAL